MINVVENEIRKVCEESITMAEAASKMGIHFNTFKRYAVKFGCYDPNQGGKGLKKTQNPSGKIPLNDILDGKHPQYQTFKLKKRLLEEGLLLNKCSCCGLMEWLGNPISIELDHIDGNRNNHSLSNLRMLCPNCHSQTPTFGSKKRN
jgi:5-methylcytosine-specific restriction endonuclease McrA